MVPNIREELITLHKYALRNIRCRTNQYSRSFMPNNVELWNSLDNMIFDVSDNLNSC